jgi:hypothetical protein
VDFRDLSQTDERRMLSPAVTYRLRAVVLLAADIEFSIAELTIALLSNYKQAGILLTV